MILRGIAVWLLAFCPYAAAQPWYGTTNAKKLNGVPIAPTAPTNGQGLCYNSSTGKYEPGTCSGGGGSGTGIPYCVDAGGDDAYTPTCTPTVSAYTTGQVYGLVVATANTGAATANLGPSVLNIKVADCTSDPSDSDLLPSRQYLTWYNGTSLCLIEQRSNGSEIPNPAGKDDGSLVTDGTNWFWSYANGGRDSGTQSITGVSGTIDCGTTTANARRNVNVDPDGTYTLTSAPTIADGYDGQLCTITNLDTSLTLTVPDESVTASSNLRLGGSSVAIGPRGSLSIKYSGDLGVWVRTDTVGTSTTPTSAVIKSAVPQLSISPGSANNASATVSVDFDTYTAGDSIVCTARWSKGGTAAALFATGIGATNSSSITSGATNTFFITEHFIGQVSAGNQIWSTRMLRGSAVASAGDTPSAFSTATTATGVTDVKIEGWTTGGETMVLQAYTCIKYEAVP